LSNISSSGFLNPSSVGEETVGAINILPLFRSFLTLFPTFLLLLSTSGDFSLLFVFRLMTSFGFSVGGMNTIVLANPFCDDTLVYGKLLTLVAFAFGVCLVTDGF